MTQVNPKHTQSAVDTDAIQHKISPAKQSNHIKSSQIRFLNKAHTGSRQNFLSNFAWSSRTDYVTPHITSELFPIRCFVTLILVTPETFNAQSSMAMSHQGAPPRQSPFGRETLHPSNHPTCSMKKSHLQSWATVRTNGHVSTIQ